VLADNALLLGYAKGTKKIASSIVKECYEDLRIEETAKIETSQKIQPKEVQEPELVKKAKRWRWAAVLLLCLLLISGMLSLAGKKIFHRFVTAEPSTYKQVSDMSAENPLEKRSDIEVKTQERQWIDSGNVQSINDKNKNEVTENAVMTKTLSEERLHSEDLLAKERRFGDPTQGNIKPGKSPETMLAKDEVSSEKKRFNEPIEQESRLLTQGKGPSETTRIVKENDTLTLPSMEVYGKVDEEILEQVHRRNPGIADINWIYAGQRIVFPPLSISNEKAMFTVHIASYKPFSPAFEMFQKLMKAGYEVYLMPADSPDKGTVFRLTLGAFESLNEAEDYAKTVLSGGVSEYARAIEMDVKHTKADKE
jgi:phage tail protein X